MEKLTSEKAVTVQEKHSDCREGFMVVERTITIGFRANLVTFKLGWDLKMPTGLAATNGFPFNPTYDAVKILYRTL